MSASLVPRDAPEWLLQLFGGPGTETLLDEIIDEVLVTVARAYGLEPDDLELRSRREPIATARAIAAFILTIELEIHPSRVGEILGGRHRTTVYSAVRSVFKKLAAGDLDVGILFGCLEAVKSWNGSEHRNKRSRRETAEKGS